MSAIRQGKRDLWQLEYAGCRAYSLLGLFKPELWLELGNSCSFHKPLAVHVDEHAGMLMRRFEKGIDFCLLVTIE